MKLEIEHSIRSFDNAHLTWRREKQEHELEFGFWFLVNVEV